MPKQQLVLSFLIGNNRIFTIRYSIEEIHPQ